MIVYKTSAGEGYNPLISFSHWIKCPLYLQPVTPEKIGIAKINILLSCALISLCACWISGVILASRTTLMISVVAFLLWQIGIWAVQKSQQFEISKLPETREFKPSLLTIEWFTRFFSAALYLLSAQTIELHPTVRWAFSAMGIVSVVIMCIPLAQGSYELLTRKQEKH